MGFKIQSLFFLVLLSSCTSGSKKSLPISKNYDGKLFYNTEHEEKSFWEIAKFFGGSLFYKEKWPEWVENGPQMIPRKVEVEGPVVTFINHASSLIQMGGVNVLTDPIFSERCSPVTWAGPKRVRSPGLQLEDLPPIDLVVISHNHYDHLDIPSLQALAEKNPRMKIFVPYGNGPLLESYGLELYEEFDWNEKLKIQELDIVFLENRHRSGRGLFDHMKTLWGAWLIRYNNKQVYFAGDTGYGRHFKENHERYGSMDLCLIPIGAYEPRGFMNFVHLNPEDAVMAHQDLHCKKSIGIHFGTFQLTYEAIDTPEKDLARALEKCKVPAEDFIVPGFGQAYNVE